MLWAYDKASLYASSAGNGAVVAVYQMNQQLRNAVPTGAGSLNETQNVNGSIATQLEAVRPQRRDDTSSFPMFVAQLDDARLVLASLLFTNQLATMTSTANAPPVVANVVGKGFNFSLTNVSGNGAGPGIPQPGLPNKLSSGDTGGARTYGVRVRQTDRTD